MTKTTVHQIRLTEEEKQEMRATSTAGGWASIADMIRDLVKQAAERQSTPLHPATAQPLPGHPDDAPQL